MKTSWQVMAVTSLVSLVMTAGLSSCDDGAAGSCGKIPPCGGEPAGNWKIVRFCSNATMGIVSTCPDATTNTSGISETGTITLNPDRTFQEAVTISGRYGVTYPESCLANAAIPVTCADLDTQVKAEVAQSDVLQAASCSGTASCACTLTFKPQVVTNDGTYLMAGTNLQLNASNGATSGGSYCVQGDTLHLISLDMSMGAMGMSKIVSDIVLTK